jgi:hypothetical protein
MGYPNWHNCAVSQPATPWRFLQDEVKEDEMRSEVVTLNAAR